MASQPDSTFDYIVIGAGPAGTVIASRLHQRLPSLSILLIEAGPDTRTTPLAQAISTPSSVQQLTGSSVDWNYLSTPQTHLGDYRIYNGAGKGLGGSTVLNYGLWSRGEASDYRVWSTKIGDDRWSWEGLLPYFKRSEKHYDANCVKGVHGHDGPIGTASVRSSGRIYPLRQPLKEAWKEMGIEECEDLNAGSALGITEAIESRTDEGGRVLATEAYSLDGVTILSSTMVSKIILETTSTGEKVATGVEIVGGKILLARKEIILSASAFRTPQLLMLSGIGPADELTKHGIPLLVDSPSVGKNLWDHLTYIQFWKLTPEYIEAGSAIGPHPRWSEKRYQIANPYEGSVNISVPRQELQDALDIDGVVTGEEYNSLLKEERSHLGLLVYYAGPPFDGSTILTYCANLLPTSRGTITLAGKSVEDGVVIDPNHFSTAADRFRLRSAIRLVSQLWQSEKGKRIVESEVVTDGTKAIFPDSGDEVIDARKEAFGAYQHSSGTAAMGEVVDAELRVRGVMGLRVCDASVIPTPISSPIQALVYAMGEQAVDLILGKE